VSELQADAEAVRQNFNDVKADVQRRWPLAEPDAPEPAHGLADERAETREEEIARPSRP
jgi:hypothetical protein